MSATSNTTTTTKQLSDGNSSGEVLGQSTTGKIAFFGSTPSAQVAVADPASTAAADNNTALVALLAELRSKGLIG